MPDPQPKYQPNDPRFYTFRNKYGKNVESKQNEINQNEIKQDQPQMGGTRV